MYIVFRHTRQLILSLLLALLLCSSAWAATYVVAQGGSGTTCSYAAPCSLQYGYQTAVAGDTVQLSSSGGDFTSYYILPTNSGTVGAGGTGGYLCDSYITYENYPGETPVIRSQAYGANLSGKSCINISGITFGKTGNANKLTRWILFYNGSNRNYIYDCTFVNASSYEGIMFGDTPTKTGATNYYNVIDSCTFPDAAADPNAECGRTCGSPSDCNSCPGDAISLTDCVSCLVINNTMGRFTHDAIDLGKPPLQNYSVIKNNTITNTWHSAIDCASSSPSLLSNYVLLEENTIINMADDVASCPLAENRSSTGSSGYKGNALGSGYAQSILRRNLLYNTSHRGKGIALGSGSALHDGALTIYDRVYNNTVYGFYYPYVMPSVYSDVYGSILKNNIAHVTGAEASASPYAIRAYKSTPGSIHDNLFAANNFYSSFGTTNQYQADSKNRVGTIAYLISEFPTEWLSTNTAVNPSFRTDGSDFRLATSSPMIDVGTHLTTTANVMVDSTDLHVDDSYYFYSKETWQTPYHASIESDYIYIEDMTPSTPVRISAVTVRGSAGAGRITLAENRSWSYGKKVYLATSSTAAYYGTAPDIGRYEYVLDAAPTLGDPVEGSSQTTSPTLNLTRVGQVSVPVGDATYTHTGSQWQVIGSGGIIYDSGEVTGASMTAIVPTGLAEGQTYTWKARTKNSDGWGPYSAVKSFLTSGTSPAGSGGAVMLGPGLTGSFGLSAPGAGKGSVTLTGPP